MMKVFEAEDMPENIQHIIIECTSGCCPPESIVVYYDHPFGYPCSGEKLKIFKDYLDENGRDVGETVIITLWASC